MLLVVLQRIMDKGEHILKPKEKEHMKEEWDKTHGIMKTYIPDKRKFEKQTTKLGSSEANNLDLKHQENNIMIEEDFTKESS